MGRKSFTLAALLVAHVSLTPCAGTNLTTLQSPLVLPGSDGNILSILLLPCFADPAPLVPESTLHRWTLPNGQLVSAGSFSGRYTEAASDVGPSGTRRRQLSLLIQRLIYSDAGTYVCEYNENGQETVSASVDLILQVGLQVVGNRSITVATGFPQVGLHCEMTLYLRPDEDLQWFHDGERVVATERHTISYRDWNGIGQFGGEENQASRVSTLLISQPQMADSGIYTCAIRGTNVSQDIQLSLLGENVALTQSDPPVSIELLEIGSPHVRPGVFASFRTLACFVAPLTNNFESEWILPDQTVVSSSSGRFHRSTYFDTAEIGLLLNITRISYSDEGVYTCRFRDTSSSESSWYMNTTQLLLTVNLEANQNEAFVLDNATQMSLSCEMSIYLRPDEDFQWFRGGQPIASGSGRHSVTYTDGTARQGQFGGDVLGSSRVSTLVISQPQTSDSGTYSCAIRNTQQSQDIQLAVGSAVVKVNTTEENSTSTTSSGTEEPTASTTSSVTQEATTSSDSADSADRSQLFIYIGSGAGLLIVVVVMVVVVLCTVAMLRGGKGRAKKQADVDPVYAFIPEERQDSHAIIMTEANPAYDKVLHGSIEA